MDVCCEVQMFLLSELQVTQGSTSYTIYLKSMTVHDSVCVTSALHPYVTTKYNTPVSYNICY